VTSAEFAAIAGTANGGIATSAPVRADARIKGTRIYVSNTSEYWMWCSSPITHS
jgi:hypothetical protein